ncbi:MAG: N-acetylmuramoyl-L-alanine amidase [Blautia sp.]|nr:N-acetylmuramoyl-L-alanine amidase [Blautia sp.]
MKYFICVGHANYGGGVISSADGTKYGGVNEYKYNKELAPHVVKWLEKAGHKAVLCIAPEGKLHSLNEEINYFIGEEHKDDYDLSVQLHLNAFNGSAHGTEVYAYNAEGLKVAERICKKLATVWTDRGAQIKTGLYWTRKTKAKAVLIESFFCDSKEDYQKAKKLGMDAHAKLIAEGIVGKSISGSTGKPSSKPAVPAKPTGKAKYIVQAGAFSDKKNADALVKKLKAKGFDAIIKEV